MPTRSAPNSLALRLTSSAVTGWRKIAIILLGILVVRFLRSRRLRAFLLDALELLQLAGDDSLIAFWPDPANIPRIEAIARLAAASRGLHVFRQCDLFRRL